MATFTLTEIYKRYIECLNQQDWQHLGKFVDDDVVYNGKRIGLKGYLEMLEGDFRAIPDLYFNIELMVEEPPRIASRLSFDCTPTGLLFNLPVNGKLFSLPKIFSTNFSTKELQQCGRSSIRKQSLPNYQSSISSLRNVPFCVKRAALRSE
jgi:predicted ester cyclase